MSTETLTRVILNWPSALDLKDEAGPTPRSWIQLARVGKFVSKRYGRFEINREDLRQMLHNFNNVTPKAPTELPVDYDHLGMEPKQPLDGIAAGWMKRLELRANGDELWAEVEWTPKAAEAIKNREYRFVSPSFVKDHTHKDGTKIGTTLLAAAVCNHPFLEGMRALTLATPAIQVMTLSAELRDLVAAEQPVNLSKVGQRVSVEQADELTPEERAMTFVIADVRGEGDDAFVFLKTLDGKPFRWFRAEQLAAARGTMGSPIPPDRSKQEEVTMNDKQNADQKLIQLSDTIAREERISLRDATIEAGRRLPALAEQRRADIGVEATADDADAQTRPIINLRDGESFFALCQRTAAERQIHLTQAIRMVSAAHPEMAEAYGRGEF